MKKAWITPFKTGHSELCSLTFESDGTADHQRLNVKENIFPEKPDPDHPRRHTIVIGLLSHEDLINLEVAINTYLNKD
jgi:hypothetical protein